MIPGAAVLAIDRVNADENLLPGRRLEYRWEDSGCSVSQSLKAMGKLLAEDAGPKVDAVIGPGCSAACEITGQPSFPFQHRFLLQGICFLLVGHLAVWFVQAT